MDLNRINVINDEAREGIMQFIKDLLKEYGTVHTRQGIPASFITKLESSEDYQLANVNILKVYVEENEEEQKIVVCYEADREVIIETVSYEWNIYNLMSLADALVAFVQDIELEDCSLTIAVPDMPPTYDITGAKFTCRHIPDDKVPEGKVRFSIESLNGAPAYIHNKVKDNHYGDILVHEFDAGVIQRWIDNQGFVDIWGESIDFED